MQDFGNKNARRRERKATKRAMARQELATHKRGPNLAAINKVARSTGLV